MSLCLSVWLFVCLTAHVLSFLTPTKNHENQARIVSLAISTGLPVAAASEGPQERTSFLLLEFSPWPLRLWRRACKGMQGKSSLQTALISSNFNFLSSHVNSFKINLKFLTWVIIWLASSIYISIYNFWPYVICHHQNQCFTYASIFSWYLIPLFSKQPNRSSMRSQERMALFVSWTSHLQGGIDIFHQKKKHFILILSGAVVTNTWNTSCQPFSRLFMVGWRRSTGVSFTSSQLLFYRSHFSWPRLEPGYCWVVSPIKSSSSSSTYSLKAKEEPLMEITGVILSFCSTSAALAIHPNAHALSVWFCIYPTEGRLSTFLATWPWLDLMIVRNGGTTFAS